MSSTAVGSQPAAKLSMLLFSLDSKDAWTCSKKSTGTEKRKNKSHPGARNDDTKSKIARLGDRQDGGMEELGKPWPQFLCHSDCNRESFLVAVLSTDRIDRPADPGQVGSGANQAGRGMIRLSSQLCAICLSRL